MYYCGHCDSSYVITIETDQGPHGLYFIGMDPMEIVEVWNERDALFTMAEQALLDAEHKLNLANNDYTLPYPDSYFLRANAVFTLKCAADTANIFLFTD